MRIFLTGASGFVGTHLTERLLNAGHEVFALVRTPSKVKLIHPKLTLIKGDLNDDRFKQDFPSDIDTVIHTAGIVHSYRNEDFFEVNTKGTERLINILKEKSHSPLKFIFISSLAAAGPSKLGAPKKPNEENTPVSDYGNSKKIAEEYLLKNKNENWTTIIIRPPMVIGPKDPAVLDIFKMVKDGIIVMPGMDSKTKEYSFVCVFDLVETIFLTLNLNCDGIFYSAFPSPISFHELILAIKTEMKKEKIIFLPLPQAMVSIAAHSLALLHKFFPHGLRLTPDKTYELFPNSWICDSHETVKILGQNFEYNLEKTIKVTYSDYSQSGVL